MTDKRLGIKVNGGFFDKDGRVLTWESFIEKIESVGLEYSGQTLPIDEEGNIYEIKDNGTWAIGKKIGNEFK